MRAKVVIYQNLFTVSKLHMYTLVQLQGTPCVWLNLQYAISVGYDI